MADPISVVFMVLKGLHDIKAWWETYQHGKVEAQRIMERLEALTPAIDSLKNATIGPSIVPALRNMMDVMKDVKDTIVKYFGNSCFQMFDRLAHVNKWNAEFSTLNLRRTDIASDLLLTSTVFSFASASQRRAEDLEDLQRVIANIPERMIAERREDGQATRADLDSMRAEIAAHYQTLMQTMIQASGHAPLTSAELANISSQQAHLLAAMEGKFHLVLEGIHNMEGELHGVCKELHSMTLSITQQQKRASDLKKIHISPSELEIQGKLNAGGFGEVNLGRYQKQTVALKIVKHKDDTMLREDLINEIENEVLMMKLVENPNVLHLYGFAVETCRAIIVMEVSLI